MTKDEVLELFTYNAWANRTLFDACAAVPAEDYLRDLKSSHGGMHGTLCHAVWAEELWLTRWLGAPPPAVPQGKDLATLAAVRARWEHVEAERARFLAGVNDARLDETVRVQPTSGGEYRHSYRQMFRHLVNHSSYHRGQVVTMMRQVGVRPPSTDLILFYRR
ncbi:MAG TPA: DinB family protein [Gemmatimonadales bacterium]|nr:DinB family protein [Gemmatimonadales bacterium]